MAGRLRKIGVWCGVVLLVVVISAVALWHAAFRRPPEPPNVILIVIDALRADHLCCYGYEPVTSHFMSTMAGLGMVFEDVTSPSSWTKTVMPSVLTSRYPEGHGVRGINDVLSSSLLLLPEILQSNGYDTCCIHGNPWMARKFGFDQGYDRFIYGNFMKQKMDAVQVNEMALDWLAGRGEDPYFLYLHYMDVHTPYDPPEDCRLFGNSVVGLYDGGILWMDEQMRSFLCALEERGLLKNTCVVITADHGEEFWDHGEIRHGMTLYDEVLRVPMIFYYPDFIRKGGRTRRHVGLIDLAPTILDLAGLAVPDNMDGVSLLDDLRVSPFRSRRGRVLFSQVGLNDVASGKDLIAVTTAEYKYISDRLSSAEELYDRVHDPGETNDISASMPELTEKFRAMVREFCRDQRSRRPGAVGKVDIDAESAEKLKSLGYLR